MVGQHVVIRNIKTIKKEYKNKPGQIISEHSKFGEPVSALVRLDEDSRIVSVFIKQLRDFSEPDNDLDMDYSK